MVENNTTLIIIIICVNFCCFYNIVLCCNEAVCSSVVTKCLLVQSCMCKGGNHTCYKECFGCLEDYALDCCSCLGFCPEREIPDSNLAGKSYVEDIPEADSGLFKALAEVPDDLGRWTIKRLDESCSVIFINDCLSVNRCAKYCTSMGSVSYRWWFHDGCCQCVGPSCPPYGLNQSQCSGCSSTDTKTPDDDYDDYDYGFEE